MWLPIAIVVCAVALVGLLVFMGVPDMLLHPPHPETYSPTPIPTMAAPAPFHAPPKAQAKVSEFATVDLFALEAPADMEKDVARLAGYLRGGARGDRQRIRALYRWVCDRIAYDTVSYRNHVFPNTDGNYTLQRKQAICGGYAQLLYELGRASGLKIELVVGKARGSALSRAGTTERHAWNAVRLDSRWYLLDPTWGAGTVDDDFVYEKNFNEAYFLIPPEQLRYSHFPDHPFWQLRAKPLTAQEFLNQPVLTPAFFKLGLSWKKSPPLHLRNVQYLDIQMEHRVDLQAGLLPLEGADREEIEGATLVTYSGSRARIWIAPPKSGRYRLALLGAEWEDESSQAIAEFELVANQASKAGFPEQAEAYVRRHVSLLQPTSGLLKPGTQHFRLEAPGARSVTCAGVELSLKGEFFEGDVQVGAGWMNVEADFEGEPERLLTYKVGH
ncbi:hypothetical protein JST97_18905 [bacterium]|nr:hypothetical protein [bacterium]